MSFLKNKKVLILGLLSDRSIAYGIASSMKKQGADLAFTYQMEKHKERVQKLASHFDSNIVLPCDVASDEDIKKIISKAKSIQKDSEILSEKLATASSEEIEEILRDAGGVSETDILALVEKKKEVELIEVSFLERTMSKLYSRLVRDRELGVEEAFCLNIEGILDHLLVPPSYFDTDKHSIDDYLNQISDSFELLQPILDEYPDVVVSLEGNADERGTVEYNKALSDRRWETPTKVLQALYFDEERTLGVGRSEQCPLPRGEGTSTNDWWSKNRRTDYIFKLE